MLRRYASENWDMLASLNRASAQMEFEHQLCSEFLTEEAIFSKGKGVWVKKLKSYSGNLSFMRWGIFLSFYLVKDGWAFGSVIPQGHVKFDVSVQVKDIGKSISCK
jgi:hypothetical protein